MPHSHLPLTIPPFLLPRSPFQPFPLSFFPFPPFLSLPIPFLPIRLPFLSLSLSRPCSLPMSPLLFIIFLPLSSLISTNPFTAVGFYGQFCRLWVCFSYLYRQITVELVGWEISMPCQHTNRLYQRQSLGWRFSSTDTLTSQPRCIFVQRRPKWEKIGEAHLSYQNMHSRFRIERHKY